MIVRSVAAACALALLAACSGRMGPSGALPAGISNDGIAASQSASRSKQAQGRLVLRVKMRAHRGASPHFVSPATKGMTVKITGPTNVNETVGLVESAKGCVSSLMTITCTLIVPSLTACPSTHKCYTASVATYDAFKASTNKIPPSAKELSADADFSFSIATGDTIVPLVLEGIPKSIAFVPKAGSSLTGSQTAGFVEPKCTASTQSVTLTGIDADGNYIVGPGEPKTTLASSNTAQLKPEHSAAATPNTFKLIPPSAPAYAYGGYTTHLTVSAIPAPASGVTTPATAVVNVAYSGAICGVITEFPVATAASGPYGIAVGPDGNIWFTESSGDKIGRVTLTGTITEFPVPDAAALPTGIAAGPDGNVWFTESGLAKMGRMTTAGSAVGFATTTAASQPLDITTGPDGNMWFTEGGVAKIGTMTTAGTPVAEYGVTASSEPFGITSAGGKLWFAELGGNRIGSITTSGSLLETTVPTSGSQPPDVAAGSDGALWFTELNGNKIGRITTANVITGEYAVPEVASEPDFIAAGPDGGLWFAELAGNRIDGMTLSGVFTEYAIPTGTSQPYHLIAGPDGSIWFTEHAGNKIGRLY